jgi:phosphoglycerate dehydrogenase-like enzyme
MSTHAERFLVGVTRDLRAPDGSLRLGSLAPLEQAPGVEWQFLQHDGPEADPRDLADVDAVIVFGTHVTAATLGGARRLRLLARTGAGYDNVDLAACTARGVLLTTTPDAVRRPMAAATLALLLALAHRLVIKDRLVRTGAWAERAAHVGDRLDGRTLGVLGFGNIARELMRLAKPLDMRQIAYGPRLQAADAALHGVEAVSLENLLRESDYLVVACPLNEETRGLLDAARLAQMQPSASLINIARGAIVDERALIAALCEGRLAGAALDVFEQEPVDPANPLLALEQVILAPHAIGHTEALFEAAFAGACQSVLDVAAGRLPAGALNPEAL